MINQGVERLVALTGARSVYDDDPLQAIRRDLATIATQSSSARKQAWCRMGGF